MSNNKYFTETDLDRPDRLYKSADENYQYAAVAYKYGVDLEKAKEMHTSELTQTEIADSCDYFNVSDLPDNKRQHMYEILKVRRNWVESEYGLEPLDASMKRDKIMEIQHDIYFHHNPDKEYQIGAARWWFDTNYEDAAVKCESISEEEMADICDHWRTVWLDSDFKEEFYQKLHNERIQVMADYGLSPIEAITKRDNLATKQFLEELNEQDFSDAISAIDNLDNGVKQNM